MTDNDIKKALECCQTQYDRNCKECPYQKHKSHSISITACSSELRKDLLDLFNHLEAENERLETEKDNLIKTYSECQVANLKEFAERLKEETEVYTDSAEDDFILAVGISKIDSALKEMVGEDKCLKRC